MPMCGYHCAKCGLHFERFQGMSDRPVEECPECGGMVERLIGLGARVVAKGSGAHANAGSALGPCDGSGKPCEN